MFKILLPIFVSGLAEALSVDNDTLLFACAVYGLVYGHIRGATIWSIPLIVPKLRFFYVTARGQDVCRKTVKILYSYAIAVSADLVDIGAFTLHEKVGYCVSKGDDMTVNI
jgi:hypothetical protein